MMTRAELEATLKQARLFGGYGLEPFFDSLLAHDAEQRAEIERLRHEYSQLKEAYDAKASGVPLGPIVGAQTIVNQQMEIARLREALKGAMDLVDVDNLTTQTVYRNCQQALKESIGNGTSSHGG